MSRSERRQWKSSLLGKQGRSPNQVTYFARSPLQKLAVVALLVAATTTSTIAQVETIFSNGDWEVSAGKTNDASAVCIAQTGGTDKGGYWSFGLKKFDGDGEVQLWISQESWKIPSDVETTVRVEFDQRGAWTVNVFGHVEEDTILWGLIGSNSEGAFFEEMMKAKTALITFSGNEPPWRISMDGSAASALKFTECVNIIRDVPRQPAQPFDSNPQPFDKPDRSTPAELTQPFVPA